jgi:transmembrane protein TMEM131/LysM domain-containing protein
MKNRISFRLVRQRAVAAILIGHLLASPVCRADCPPWNPCQLVKGAETVWNGGKQVVNGAVEGGKKIFDGGLNVLKAGGQAVTGHFGDAWKTVQDGGKEIINGVIQVAVSGVVTAATMADPLIGVVFFGQPTPLQGLSKLIYDIIAHWKGHPDCNPGEQISRLMTIPKKTLDDASRLLGAASTPAKYLSSIFDGYGAWEPTGCDGVGIGRPVREAQLSTDGLWTVDVAISDFDIQGTQAPPGRFIRLEVFPNTNAHDSIAGHTPTSADVIRFRGPMMWDKDTDGDHPHGHMEVHPLAAIEFGIKTNQGDKPIASVSPTALNFGNQLIHSNSAAQNVLVVNSGRSPFSITAVAVTGVNSTDFKTNHTCTKEVAPGDGCTIAVIFTPSALAPESASINVSDNADSSPHVVTLNGTGVSPGAGGIVDQSGYEVVRGDCLARIAERFYGDQRWPVVFCANRKQIRDPDLIYPGQQLRLPLPGEEIKGKKCLVPKK